MYCVRTVELLLLVVGTRNDAVSLYMDAAATNKEVGNERDGTSQ
jgi:hypothetical protein